MSYFSEFRIKILYTSSEIDKITEIDDFIKSFLHNKENIGCAHIIDEYEGYCWGQHMPKALLQVLRESA